MTDVPSFDQPDALNRREQLARIDHMIADNHILSRIIRINVDHERIVADTRRTNTNHDRKRQKIRYASWVLIVPTIVGVLIAGGALVTAGALLVKIYGTVP